LIDWLRLDKSFTATKVHPVSANRETVELQLDFATLRTLDALAQGWGVSRDAAAKRVIREAIPQANTPAPAAKIAVLKELQRSLSLTREKADDWQSAVGDARR
jgi:hypothetical protein